MPLKDQVKRINKNNSNIIPNMKAINKYNIDIEIARKVIEDLKKGDYSGLVVTTPPVPGNSEKEESITKDDRKQNLLRKGFWGMTPGLTPDNKMSDGGVVKKKI